MIYFIDDAFTWGDWMRFAGEHGEWQNIKHQLQAQMMGWV